MTEFPPKSQSGMFARVVAFFARVFRFRSVRTARWLDEFDGWDEK